jgi:hypothetical protein
MSKELYNTYSNDDNFIVKRKRSEVIGGFVGGSVFTILTIVVFIDLFLKTPKSQQHLSLQSLLFLLIMFVLIGMFWFPALDSKPKLIINKSGLWSKELGFIAWGSIWYFSLDEKDTQRAVSKNLFFKLLDNEKIFRIHLTFMDKTMAEIHDAVIKYSNNPALLDLGYSYHPKGSNEYRIG